MVGPMARPRARGLGPGLSFKYEIGPGLDIIVAGRAGLGPHNSICGPGPGRVCTTAAGSGRAWSSNHICGPGLGLDFRPVQGPTVYIFQSVLPLLLFSSYPFPILTMHHIPLCKCGGLCKFVFLPDTQNAKAS